MADTQRLAWADTAKGIGIILVVFAHTIVPSLREAGAAGAFIWIFIYNFHMPLFFFISGWLFEKSRSRHNEKLPFIADKGRKLMLPYLVFSLLAYAFVFAAMRIGALNRVLSSGGYGAFSARDAILGILFYFEHIDKHLWFLYSLFIVFTLNILFPKTMKSKPAIFVLLILYVSKAFVHYPAILDYTASDLVFFSLARAVCEKRTSPAAKTPLEFVCAAVIFLAANITYSYFYITKMPDSAVLKAWLYILRSLCSFAGIVTVCTAAEFISKKASARFFAGLGMYSLDIYLIHAPFLVSGLMGILLSYSPLPAPLCCALVTVTGIALPYILSRFIIRKMPPLAFIVLGLKKRQTL